MSEKIETAATELLTAAFDLHTEITAQHPRWNTWEPRLLTLGRSFLELQAARGVGGLALGMAQASRIVLDWKDRESSAALELLRLPYRRLTTAISRAVLLPDKDIAASAVRVGEAATGVMTAYGADNLYRQKAATAKRREADAAFQEAIGELAQTTRNRLQSPPAVLPRRRWWRIRRAPEDTRGVRH
jgi:hypothetical protein